ncbi:MAG: hypothetical protein WC516_04970 [Patescibacteria group bacterium]|jgi:hypothetical protein
MPPIINFNLLPIGQAFKFDDDEAKFGDKIGTLIKENLDDLYRNRRSTLYILPAISRQVLMTVQKLDCWIAGGAALALYTGDVEKIKDWDLFFKSWDFLYYAKAEFENQGFVETTTSDWSISLEKSGVIVQLVTRHFYNKIEEIFGKFDFTICCFAIQGKDIYYTKTAIDDFEKKEFNFIYTENLPTCIKRIARYGAKGFTPSSEFTQDIAKVFKNITAKKLKTMKATSKS